MNITPQTRVGLAVFIKKANKIAIGLRRGPHGGDTWGLPGGHLEYNESFTECARRETTEETGLEIDNIRFGHLTNDFFTETSKHYVTIFMVADYKNGELEVREPNKCKEWRWFGWDELPSPLFLPFQNLLKDGYNPFA